MDNFYVTAERMYEDLDILYNKKRWFNTCYLSGYVVECYAKLILSQVLGKNPSEIKSFSHSLSNLNIQLQDILNSFISGGDIPPTYLHDIDKMCPTICTSNQHWHPEYRYNDGTSIWGESTAHEYYKEVNELIVEIIQMKIDGVIK